MYQSGSFLFLAFDLCPKNFDLPPESKAQSPKTKAHVFPERIDARQ
jgi:hypothetical protein